MRRWLGALLALVWPTGPALAAAPQCIASVELEPAVAFVDQQVLYRMRLLTREDVESVEWLVPPSFPDMRAERLPGEPAGGVSVRDGARYALREEQRALFPERAGRLALPAARLRCGADGEVAEVPAAVLEVRPLPESGRPQGFDGLVGELQVRRRVEPLSLALGGSLRLEVTLQGGGNLWDAPAPFVGAPFGSAEVFETPSKLQLDRGGDLLVRRVFRYEIVPRETGPLTIPEIAFGYFDPARGRYAETRAPAVTVNVTETPSAGSTPPTPAASTPETGPGDVGRAGLWYAGIALSLVAVAIALALRRGRDPAAPALEALEAAQRSASSNDSEGEAAALARALRAALASRESGPAARRAADLLAALERSRFDPTAEPPRPEDVAQAVRSLLG